MLAALTHRRLIRHLDGGTYVEWFLIAAVGSVLAIRFGLHVTGYPQLGSDSLHVAHMLWGGLLMLAALIMLLAALGRPAVTFGAIVGGAGFGIFIDELGKFLTKDNDYFFQPTVALLYLIFVGLFFLSRQLDRRRPVSHDTAVLNALRLVEEAALKHLDARERQKILHLIAHAPADDRFVRHLRAMVTDAPLVPVAPPNTFERLYRDLVNLIRRGVDAPWFQPLLVLYFTSQAIIGVGYALVLAIDRTFDTPLEVTVAALGNNSFIGWAQLVFSIMSSTIIVIGVILLQRAYETALRCFQIALLITIFITQFFAFYQEQVSAVFGLAWSIVVLSAVNGLIHDLHARQAPVITPASRDDVARTNPGA